jgi:hypothetical protein
MGYGDEARGFARGRESLAHSRASAQLFATRTDSTAITLKSVSCGTELKIVQEGLPAVISTEACSLGWQESLTLLANLVEAEIPD